MTGDVVSFWVLIGADFLVGLLWPKESCNFLFSKNILKVRRSGEEREGHIYEGIAKRYRSGRFPKGEGLRTSFFAIVTLFYS